MARLRFTLLLIPTVLAVLPTVAFAGPFKNKPKPDAARAQTLIETLKSDPDDKKRRAAADELGGADSRQTPDVATALATALQKDASAAVRAEAAQSLGQLDQVFPLAGVALEAVAAGDASPAVRLAAKRALWEYHLNGYRSPKGGEGVTAQTVEPPIAAPGGTRPVVALVPAPPPPTAPLYPPPGAPTAALPPVAPPVAPPASQPTRTPVAPAVGPRLLRPSFLADLMPNLRPAARPTALNGPPPILNMTAEPPVARRPAVTIPVLPAAPAVEPVLVPPPTLALPPPPPAAPRKPDYIPTLPPFMPDLPPVVLPPDATPFVSPPTVPKIPATLPPLR